MSLVVKNLPANAEDIRVAGSISGLRRSLGGRYGNPLQYSCLENPMDRGAWWAVARWVAKSGTWLKWLSIQTQNNCTYLISHKAIDIYIHNNFYLERNSTLVSAVNQWQVSAFSPLSPEHDKLQFRRMTPFCNQSLWGALSVPLTYSCAENPLEKLSLYLLVLYHDPLCVPCPGPSNLTIAGAVSMSFQNSVSWRGRCWSQWTAGNVTVFYSCLIL